MGLKRLIRRFLGIESREKAKEKKTKLPKPPKAPKIPKPVLFDPFPELVARYEQRLRREWQRAFLPASSRSPEVAFLVTPWLGTAVPMFNMETALLTRNQGRAVRLIFDDTEVAQNAEVASHRAALRALLCLVTTILPVTDVSGEPDFEGCSDTTAAQRICDNIAIWWERGETTASAFYKRNPDAVRRVACHLAKVRHLLTDLRPGHLFIPGGIFGLSAIYVRIAGELNIPFTTYDSNHSVVMVSHDSVACHRRDFPRVLKRIQESLTKEQHEAVRRIVEGVFKTHKQGRDDLGIQMVADQQGESERYDILVPLNIRWDAAALGCEHCFSSCMSWLEALLAWVESDGRYSVCLREHPAGRFAGAGSNDDYSPLLRRFSSLGSRLRFIAANEPVSTYDLMTRCKLVLPYTSTVGIEAAMLGKPVVTHTSVYYANVGFGWAASDAEEYLRLVAEALEGRLEMKDSRREQAMIAYYVANCAWFLPGVFNPHPEPFKTWAELTPKQLLETTGAREIVDALLHDEDVPFYLHGKNMASA